MATQRPKQKLQGITVYYAALLEKGKDKPSMTSTLESFPGRGFGGVKPPSRQVSAHAALTPTASLVLKYDESQSTQPIEPFMPAGGFSMPYRVFGRSTPKAFLTGVAFTLVFFIFFFLGYLFSPWHPGTETTTLAYGLMARSPPNSCPLGTNFQEDRKRCEVMTNPESAIDPDIMLPSADPCSSVYLYAAGGWNGAEDIDMRTFDSVRRTVNETIPLLGSVVARDVGMTHFHDFVVSCLRTAAHPNASSDASFVLGMLDELEGNGLENHTDVFRGAYALGRQFGMGISTLISTTSAVNPRNTVQSLLFWDVGTMIKQMAFASESTSQWSFDEGCRTLAFLERMDNVLYADWRDCSRDARSIMTQAMEAAQNTAGDGQDITYDYIQHTMQRRDIFTRSELGRATNGEFVDGYLAGMVAALSDFVDFVRSKGLSVPNVMNLNQWTMRRRYINDIAQIVNATGPQRWSQFVAVTTIIFGMEVPLTLLHAPSAGGSVPQQQQRFLDMSFNQAYHQSAQLVDPDTVRGSPLHSKWISTSGTKRKALPTRSVDAPVDHGTDPVNGLTEMMKTEMTRACTLLALQNMDRSGEMGMRNIIVSRDTTESATGMAETIREAFVNEIVLSTAIPPDAKSPFALKISEVSVVLGAPEDELVTLGIAVDPEASVLSNVVSMNRRAVAMDALGAVHHEGTTSPMRPASTLRTDAEVPSAYYDPTSNTVFISTALLTPPFFFTGWPIVEQYATLGFVIARSMAKAVGTEGVMFSVSGSLDPIVSSAVMQAHNSTINALCEQYLSGQGRCQGLLPDEIFADVFGINVVLRALETVGGGPGTPELRKFVIAFAQTWASARTMNVRQVAREDGFVPADIRVDRLASYMRTPEGVPVMKSAFQCPTESRLMHSTPIEIS